MTEERSSIERRVPAADGTELLVRDWPAPAEPIAHVLIVHGLAEHSGRYEQVGIWLSRAGFAAHAYDLRGFGASGGRRAWADGVPQLLDDLADRVAAVRAGARGTPTAVYGHSLGALFALGCALDGTLRSELLVLSAPAIAATIPLATRLALHVLGRIAPGVEVPNRIRGEQLSRDPAVGRRYVTDPRNHHRTTARLGLALLSEQERVSAALPRLAVRALVIHGAEDTLVPTASSEPLGRLPGVERRVYPGIRHELHNEPEGAAIVADVAAWLRQQVAADQIPSG